ncbi:chromosome segregation SMC family protein [Sphingomonas sp. Leaf25]|uniref:chromosome segregation SMC family protein n=1 Tax=Sphingomonas sp. Leaf25 TaxID=1735692 RepID=UPI0006F92DA0|nr:AAA family ATPase [Sphingomonas sp. Leaf25]KQN07649.1 chromosome segregation protein [Sphingomonas sp. Leaf25]
MATATPALTIRRLRLTGFKSFVDPAELVIEPGLTGVVGPNGCGKSNLLEALRWTMGENSAKSLRGAGMEDVIFAGTATRPPRDFAEVAILAEDAAGDEVEIVRRIERGAGSAYRINGRDVRAKDVGLRFADAATGAHSPALVSQNRIGAVIAARPSERRAMLEETAGIAGLHVRRRDAEAKLRATEANLERLGELLAEQDVRIAALRRQAKAAMRYRELTARIRVAEARALYARWRDVAARADAARAAARAADAAVVAAHAAHEQAATAQTHATATLVAARASAQSLHARLSDAQHARDAAQARLASATRRVADLTAQADRLTADHARESLLAQDAAAAIARLTDEADRLTEALGHARTRRPALDAALAAAERDALTAGEAHAAALAAQAAETAEARVATAAHDAARARLDRAERDAARLAAEAATHHPLGPLLADRDSAHATRTAALAAAGDARAAIVRADADDRAARDARATAQATRAAAAAELAAADAEIAALDRALRRPGTTRLIDTIRVEPGYERALAAALGDDLDAGIDPVDDRHWAAAPDPAPPPAGSLAAHVVAPRLAARLAQVLLVERDDGRPLALGQRLVTLAGDLRRWDGYVARAGSGAAAAERLARANRLRALQGARATLADRRDAADSALKTADTAIATAQTGLTAARAALDAADAAARTATRAEDRAIAAIERAQGRADDLAARADRIARDVADARADLSSADTIVAHLPDGTVTRARVTEAATAADTARANVAAARAAALANASAERADHARLTAATSERTGWQDRAAQAAGRLREIEALTATLAADRAGLADRPQRLAADLATADRDVAALRPAAAQAHAAEQAAATDLRTADTALARAAEALATAREGRAGTAARAEADEQRRRDATRESGERFQCPPVLLPATGFPAADVGAADTEAATHDRLIAERDRIGAVNLIAEGELAELEAAQGSAARDRADLSQAIAQLRGSVATLNREGRQRLLTAFTAVDAHFRRLFSALFQGGQAELALIDSEDPLEAGLEILAQPPGKRLQSLTLLSGGEQALTAVALIFALFLTNPAPICVLDEVDAPLDDANIDRFCDLLDRMAADTDTRYLIVTHNAATMSRMHRLFGVTMVERGISRLVSVDLGGATTLVASS